MNSRTKTKVLLGQLSAAALLLSACQLFPLPPAPQNQQEALPDELTYLLIDRAMQREYFKERLLSVEALEGGGWVLSFESSSRYHYIHDTRSPDARQMVDFARGALEDDRPVFVTIDVSPPGGEREGRAWVPVVLWLADMPDPERPQG